MKRPFGWSYPAGTENDPNAPWNQTDNPPSEVASDPPCTTCDGTGEVTLMVCYGGKPMESTGDCPDCTTQK